jgi:tetratricopeptide (TPR) repeat protein
MALFLNRNLLFASLGYETAASRLRGDINQARTLASKGQLDKALELANGLHRDHPSDLRIISFLLDLNIQTGRPSQTEQLATRVLVKNPELHGFRLRLGEAQRQLGRLEEAHATLSKVVGKLPESIWAHFYLGRVLMDAQRTEEAEGKFRLVLQRSPQFLGAQLQLGDLLEQNGRNHEALDFYRKSDLPLVQSRVEVLEKRLGITRPVNEHTSHGPRTSGG